MLAQLVLAVAAGVAYWAHQQDSAEAPAVAGGDAPSPAAGRAKLGAEDKRLFLDDAQQQCRREMALQSVEPSLQERLSRRFFVRSSVLLGTAAVSAWVYPPLLFLHIPVLFYLSIPRYQEARQDVLEEGKISINVVSSVSSLGCLAYAAVYPAMVTVFAASAWLYALSQQLVYRTQDHTRRNLANLFGEQPRRVWVVHEGVEMEVAFESVVAGDVLVVDAGQMIPIDGVIYEGMASIDEHMLTGESRPAEKSVGEAVFASTLVLAGRIFVRIEKTGHATVAAQIGDLLKDTSGIAMSGQLRGQALSDLYAPPTLGLGLLALPVAGIEAALAVLVSGIAGNMRLLGPISVLSFLQKSARRGILIKDGRALEQFSQIDTVVFDKTGTLTMKQPALGEIHPAGVYSEDILLAYAAAAEHRQTHPIAIAIREAAQARGLELPAISEAAYEIGYGIKVNVDGRLIRVGSDRFMAQEAIFIPPHILDLADAAHSQGHTLIYVGIDGLLGGMIEMCPSVRPEARRVINYLRKAGMDVVVLSGDHEKPTRVLAEQLGITHYFAETLPEQKAEHIARMQGEGRFVCFVGDGINDSIALKKAQVSISLSGASAIATDTAQIILMDKTLNRLDELFELASAFESSIHRDLLTSALPGAVIVGGAFAGSVNLATAFALLWLGSIAGLANALSPALASGADTSRKPH